MFPPREVYTPSPKVDGPSSRGVIPYGTQRGAFPLREVDTLVRKLTALRFEVDVSFDDPCMIGGMRLWHGPRYCLTVFMYLCSFEMENHVRPLRSFLDQ